MQTFFSENKMKSYAHINFNITDVWKDLLVELPNRLSVICKTVHYVTQCDSSNKKQKVFRDHMKRSFSENMEPPFLKKDVVIRSWKFREKFLFRSIKKIILLLYLLHVMVYVTRVLYFITTVRVSRFD